MLLSCEPTHETEPSPRVNTLERRDASFTQTGGETVYLTKRTTGPNGDLLSSSVEGSINLERWAAAARPTAAEASRSGSIFNEGAWEILDENGNTLRGYVMTRENYLDEMIPLVEEKRISSEVSRWIQGGNESEVRPLVVRFEGFAEWNIPLMPPIDLLTPDEVQLGIQQRQNAIEERKNRLKTVAARVAQSASAIDYIEMWVTGEIFLLGTPRVAAQLQNSAEVVQIEMDQPVSSNACSTDPACSGANAFSPLTQWRLGQGRRANRTNVDSFHSQGWTGERANPSRHSYGDIIISITEVGTFEDEYLGFNDSTIYNPMSRIASRLRCDLGTCASVIDFVESGSTGEHATNVASAAAANFQNNQAYNVAYNDSCYVGSWSHCPLWEEAASGYAPEASLQLIANATTDVRTANAIGKQIESSVDIANFSLSQKEICPRCKVHAWTSTQTAAENAYDDGIFVVNAPDNNIPDPYACSAPGVPMGCKCNDADQFAKEPFQWGDCTLDSPGNVPKVFAVNALNAACLANYQDCGFNSGSWGGMDAKFPSGAVMAGVVSGIDMIAPGRKTFLGTASDCTPGQDWGCVRYTVENGTSIAAPVVAGAGAILKDGMLAGGHHFINSPGRLHTIMLAMADRTDGSGSAKASGTHALWGMGKLKMRRTSEISGGWGLWTKTFTPSSGNYVQRAFGTAPLPASASFMKCVFFEAEDVSHKDTVGDLYFSLALGNPVGGSCPTTPSGSSTVGSDASFDLKHMVAYSGSLHNKCPYFTVHKGDVAGSSITTHTYCSYGNQNDSWPN